jgi:hypothetical protein
MRASAKRTVYYRYPVELVWKAIGGSKRQVDPLEEDEFEHTEPAPNTVFTKTLEFRRNECFAIRMKARGFFADLRLDLTPTGPCETKVVFSETVEYRLVSAYVFSRFGLRVRDELKSFARQIHQRLSDMEMK